jgi:hypothetical protein
MTIQEHEGAKLRRVLVVEPPQPLEYNAHYPEVGVDVELQRK